MTSSYGNKVFAFNQLVQDGLKDVPNVEFWKHRIPYAEHMYARDGTHFSELGEKRLFCGIRRSLNKFSFFRA